MAGDSLHYSAPATHIISYNGSRTNLTMQSGDQAIVDRTKALGSKSGNQTTCRLGIRNSFVTFQVLDTFTGLHNGAFEQ